MSKIDKIEKEIRRLTAEELAAFRKWFAEFDGSIWDRQIEEDIRAGRLEEAGRQADAEFEAGRCKPL